MYNAADGANNAMSMPVPERKGSEVQEVNSKPISMPSPVHYGSTPHNNAPAMPVQSNASSQPAPHPQMSYEHPPGDPQYLYQHHDLKVTRWKWDCSNPCCWPCAL